MSNMYVYVAYVCTKKTLKNHNKFPVFAHTWWIKAHSDSDQCNAPLFNKSIKYYFPNKQPNKQCYVHKMLSRVVIKVWPHLEHLMRLMSTGKILVQTIHDQRVFTYSLRDMRILPETKTVLKQPYKSYKINKVCNIHQYLLLSFVSKFLFIQQLKHSAL